MADLISYLEAAGAKPSSNGEWILDCPWCGKSGHLYINGEPSEGADGRPLPPGRFLCFRCGQRGMAFARLMAELEGIPLQQARAAVSRWKVRDIRWKRITAPQPAPVGDAWLPPEFEPTTKVWPRYLARRGVSKEVAARFGLGVCRSGDFADRVILPIVCPAGRSFTARSIRTADEEPLRYKSGPGAGGLLFGWETIAEAKEAVVVEGPFDALRVIAAGLPAVAILGKQLRDAQADMLLAPPHRRYVVMLDPDAREAGVAVAGRLRGGVAVGLSADPGDSEPEDIRAAFSAAIGGIKARTLGISDTLASFRGGG
jgi:DNA primase